MLLFWRCHAKSLKKERNQGQLTWKEKPVSGYSWDAAQKIVFPARSGTGCPVPQPAEELEHRRRGWVHCVCSVMKREGYRETYPPPATAWWERTQTVLKGTQGRRGASTRAATWDITALYGGENFLFSGKWITETEVQRVCWTFILGDNEKCPVHGLEQPDQMGFRLVSRMG